MAILNELKIGLALRGYSTIKKMQKNVIKKNNNHHNSLGHYFSFGNKANFFVQDNSSISTYKTRRAHGPYEQKELDDMAMEYEMKYVEHLEMAQNILCTVFPLTKVLVMPIILAVDH